MSDIVGYAVIKKENTGVFTGDALAFTQDRVRVLEFSIDGSVLCVDASGTNMGMFDKKDVQTSFQCELFGEYICPPGLSFMGKIAYANCCGIRKGGYVRIMKEMIIQGSLMKKTFTDSMLWQLQDEELQKMVAAAKLMLEK